MKKEKIEIILHKFLDNTATPYEIDILIQWVEKNKSRFQEEVELHHLITGGAEKVKMERFKKDLMSAFDNFNGDRRPKKWKLPLRYAAIFVGFIMLGIYVYLQSDPKVKIIENGATITLEEGSTKRTLSDTSSEMVSQSDAYVVQQVGTRIIYKKSDAKGKKPAESLYNTLNVPYGKKFQVELSDGTEVYLNSGSSLTYPVIFNDKGGRNVVLKGEAYFTVTSDSLRPFSVGTQSVSAKVLGTEFNISSYQDDDESKVVLIEGSLSVSPKNTPDTSTLLLEPNQLVSYSYSDKKLSKKNVDVTSYIAWKEGILLFKNEDFYHIAKKLERHYNLKIEIKDMKLSEERYTGRFKTETIEEILLAFQRIKDFEYSIQENIVTINPKK